MKLDRFEIKNFRSIKDMTIQVNHNCLVLLGKNEAGKSNILKAIAAIYGKYDVTAKDRRKKIGNERISKKDYLLSAIYELSDDDHNEIYSAIKNSIASSDMIKFERDLSLLDFIKVAFKHVAYDREITEGSISNWIYYTFTEDAKFKFNNKLAIINDTVENVDFALDEIDENILTNDALTQLIWKYVKPIISSTITNCNYWDYSSEYLLPSDIGIEEFKLTPSICKPLENIFIVCKRDDITQEFDNAIEEDGDYLNLFSQLSAEITKIFRSIWPDFKDTSIELIPDGGLLNIKVSNKAKYKFEDRSDGFKKFISILLMLSTQARSNKLGTSDIVLIDEPDQSLYPTSARYLMNELLKISEKSLLIYSTHSQYMIDSNCIDRHLVVEKTDDVTDVLMPTEKSPYANDELLRRAIGVSIFECIKDKNIIFEGWFDKELFNKGCSFYTKKLPNTIGSVYLHGISSVETLVQIMILAQKKFIIVSDSDKASIDKKKAFCSSYSEYKDCWIDYQFITKGVSTMEDYMTQAHLEQWIKDVRGAEFSFDDTKNAIENMGNIHKDEKQSIKLNLISKLTKTKLRNEYSGFIDAILSKLESL